jgi:hypothetical protein
MTQKNDKPSAVIIKRNKDADPKQVCFPSLRLAVMKVGGSIISHFIFSAAPSAIHVEAVVPQVRQEQTLGGVPR